MEPAVALYRVGDKRAAVGHWMRGTCGPGYREPLARALPDAFDQAVTDADTLTPRRAAQSRTGGLREHRRRITVQPESAA